MKKLKSVVKQGINGLRSFQSPFMQRYPPGHFYSPIPTLSRAIESHSSAYSQRHSKECLGVDLCEQKQLELLGKFQSYYSEFDLPRLRTEPFRYYYANSFFPGGDAVILYSIMRVHKPKHIFEIGSGFSSAAMLDVNDRHMGGEVILRFIEPYPDRLYSLLSQADRSKHEIIVQELQNVESHMFDQLEENDILFIDSSHVLRVGSDVGQALFNILPRLKHGVIVHFHDIPWPFEYPEEYFRAGRAWNEAYALRAFLQYNDHFRILFFGAYMRTFFQKEISESMPVFGNTPCSSLWVQKVK